MDTNNISLSRGYLKISSYHGTPERNIIDEPAISDKDLFAGELGPSGRNCRWTLLTQPGRVVLGKLVIPEIIWA